MHQGNPKRKPLLTRYPTKSAYLKYYQPYSTGFTSFMKLKACIYKNIAITSFHASQAALAGHERKKALDLGNLPWLPFHFVAVYTHVRKDISLPITRMELKTVMFIVLMYKIRMLWTYHKIHQMLILFLQYLFLFQKQMHKFSMHACSQLTSFKILIEATQARSMVNINEQTGGAKTYMLPHDFRDFILFNIVKRCHQNVYTHTYILKP